MLGRRQEAGLGERGQRQQEAQQRQLTAFGEHRRRLLQLARPGQTSLLGPGLRSRHRGQVSEAGLDLGLFALGLDLPLGLALRLGCRARHLGLGVGMMASRGCGVGALPGPNPAQRPPDAEGGHPHRRGDLGEGLALRGEGSDPAGHLGGDLGGALGAPLAGSQDPFPALPLMDAPPLPEGDPSDIEGGRDLGDRGHPDLHELNGSEAAGEQVAGIPRVGGVAGDEDGAAAAILHDAGGEADGSGIHGEEWQPRVRIVLGQGQSVG